jgi:hypothetical protein
MKICQIIEAIEAPLYNIGREAVENGVEQWLPQVMSVLDTYTDKAQYRSQKRQIDRDDWDKWSKLRDDQYQREYDALIREDNSGLHDLLVKSFKEMLEKQLREAAISYAESKFGKVERIIPKEKYEVMQKRHLYFMQFVAVHIDIDAKYTSGNSRKAGGSFTNAPSKKQFQDTWSQENVKWGDELGFGIKLYATDNAIWLAAIGRILEKLHIEHFGEYTESYDGYTDLLKSILPTWVHEVVHLEQQVRRYLLDRVLYKYDWGMTYTPQYKKRPGFARYNSNLDAMQHFKRGGKRGFPSHLTDPEKAQMPEWIEYFGTAHEIEAHAAGAAASLVHDFVQSSNNFGLYRDDEQRQRELNRDIDSIIRDIGSGYIPENADSLNSYFNHIRGEAMQYIRLNSSAKDRPDPRVLNKVNIGARKVWTLFLNRFVKHIQSYKKPVPSYDGERNPRFRLPAPAKKPELP